MKRIKFLSIALVALLTVCGFSACNSEDGYRIGDIYPMALVTVKPYADMSGCYLQLDNHTTLYPTNVKGLPYGTHPVRAIIEYLGTDDDPKDCDRAVKVVKMNDILTKQLVQNGYLTQEELGNDPLEIVKDWVTLVEDGFLTLRFSTVTNGIGKTHVFNLVKGVNPDNPYELHLRHNANNDVTGNMVDGLVAFDLSSLPSSLNPAQTIKLVWNSFSGEKSVEFPLYGDSSISPVSAQMNTPALKME